MGYAVAFAVVPYRLRGEAEMRCDVLDFFMPHMSPDVLSVFGREMMAFLCRSSGAGPFVRPRLLKAEFHGFILDGLMAHSEPLGNRFRVCVWVMVENPLENDPLVTQLFDPLSPFHRNTKCRLMR